jgi:GNAT superfamily N-acetyltransferase
MIVVPATLADLPAWHELAREMEPLFGPMLNDPEFHAALERNIVRGTALCLRAHDGAASAPLWGALLYSPKAPVAKLNWLGVTASQRRNGIGLHLFHAMREQLHASETLEVVTFGEDHPGGLAARRFYQKLGFVAADLLEAGPDGGSRQLFRLQLRNL